MNPRRTHRFVPDRSPAPRGPGRLRRGFTLVELLVVIGIILLLLGIAVVGFNQIDRVVSSKATKTGFQNLQGMVDEFAAINGIGLLESSDPSNAAPIPVYNDPSTTSYVATSAPGDVSDPNGPNRYGSYAVQQTQQVIERLTRIPQNKQSLGNMPTKSLLPPPPGQSTPLTLPVLVDAWRNPIIFVPAGGLTGVTLNAGSTDTKNPPLTNQTIKSPDNRPFWASAGPDGDFSKGDDNVYSFQN